MQKFYNIYWKDWDKIYDEPTFEVIKQLVRQRKDNGFNIAIDKECSHGKILIDEYKALSYFEEKGIVCKLNENQSRRRWLHKAIVSTNAEELCRLMAWNRLCEKSNKEEVATSSVNVRIPK